jgi:cytochrome c oxidase assembly factor CtaG
MSAAWLPLLVLAAAYGGAAWRAGGWPLPRVAAFGAGLAVLAVALGPRLDAAADERLSAHMLQHLLVGLAAPPLLAAGAPVRLALRAGGRATRRAIADVLHAPVIRRLGHPWVGCAVFAGVLGAVHVPAVYDLALRAPAVHAVEHAALFWSAMCLWAPLVAADPVPRRAGAVGGVAVLMAAMTAMSAVSAVLAAAGRPLYAPYADWAAAHGTDALADQRTAAGIMAVGGMAVVVPVVIALAWRALLAEERRARVREGRA